MSEGASANFPSLGTLRRIIRHAREDRNMQPNPQAREEIAVLPHQYQLTSNGGEFLVFDSGVRDSGRIFIFASEQGRQFLAESEHWYADGTFKVCPELFFQLYTVHGQRGSRIFPCVFALLPNKIEPTYTRFVRELFNILNNIGDPNLVDILIDFERGAINAVQNVNQQVKVKGCFYHFSSNVWKRIQNLTV